MATHLILRPSKLTLKKHVKPKVRDNEMLFCYLLQHCESNVKEKLNHFSNKGSESYALAMGRLEREYGRPCIIIDACEQRLRTAKAVKPDDPESLKCFSDLLEKTKITLEGIGYFGSLNTQDVMTQLINKLPFEFRRIWGKESVAVEAQSGQIADFSHFVSFVVKLSEEANSLYGRRVFGTLSRARPEAHSSSTSRSGDRRKSALSSCNVNVSRIQNPQQSDRFAVETPLGWSLLGPSLSLSTTNNFSTNFVRVTKDTVHRQIESLWETDFGNATLVLDVPSSKEDRIVFKLMKQSVKQEGKHYFLPLPWRPNVILPCDNRGVAERRLASLKNVS